MNIQNKSDILCCLPIETKVRDFDARLYLALKCVEHDFSALIGSKGGVYREMFQWGKPFVFFDKGLSLRGERVYKAIREHGGVIVSLDEEGGVYRDHVFPLLYSKYHKHIINNYVAVACMWGDRQRRIVCDKYNDIDRDKMLITGHPRFDLRKPKFSSFYRKLQNRRKESMSGYILVNLTFATANNQLDYDELLRFIKGASGGKYYQSEAFALEYEYQSKLMGYFEQAIKRIAKEFPSCKVIVRPHPVEDMKVYEEEFKNFNNIIVTREGSVQEWIVDAAVVVHHDCTTAIEAFLNEKPVVSYVPIAEEKLMQQGPVEVSDIVKSEDELVRLISEALKNSEKNALNNGFKKKKEFLRNIIANVDHECSDQIVGELNKIFEGRKFPRLKRKKSKPPKPPLSKRIIHKLKSLECKLLGKQDDYAIRFKSKFPGISMEEINERIELFKEIDPALPDVEVRQIGEEAFVISEKIGVIDE